jgi:hypothetical protein
LCGPCQYCPFKQEKASLTHGSHRVGTRVKDPGISGSFEKTA